MRCTKCAYDNAEGAHFCAQCGTKIDFICPSCAAPAELFHRFCQNCGERLPWAEETETHPQGSAPSGEEGERRQVTVLFGDLSGFTTLSHRLDPEVTHELLNRYFEAVDGIIGAYGGTIDKHIGDGVMAVFGAPVAHSDDSERAMRAALDIHAALAKFHPPLTAHIGIASGTVVASGTGSDAHREYTVIGDSVNLAARLQDQAGAGETLISNAVHEVAGNRFDCAPLGAVQIKGLADPVVVWKLNGQAESLDGGQGLPFVGRRAELAQLVGMLDTCRSEASGQTILLRGEPGIGKTRLLEEYRNLATEQGFGWHGGLVLDFGAGKGSGAVATVVRGLLGIALSGDVDEQSQAVSDAVSGGVVDADQRVYLNDLLSLPQPTELRALYDAMDDATRTAGKEALIARLVKDVADAAPIVIAIEDIHWADSATLSSLARIASTCSTAAALLVMTSRIEGDPIDSAWRATAAGAALMTVDLGPLRPGEAFRFACDFFKATDHFARSCVERAGGNPLFLEQLLRGAEEVSESEIPGSVQSIVLTRMDNLELEDRRALQAASVLGQRFSIDVLRHLMENRVYDCRGLVQHFLIRPEGTSFLFTHALVRDGVYSSLLKGRRTALHRRAADWFSSSDLPLWAEHLDLAGDSSAAGAYLAAAQEEAEAYRNEGALNLSERGLAIADQVVRHAILCFRGNLLRGLGEIDKSIAAFEQALEASADDVQRSPAWIGLAEGLRVSDRPGEALEALDNAEITSADGPPLALAEIHHLRGNLYFPAGRFDDCLVQHEKALKFAREAGSREWEARALGGLGDASYLAGRMRTACNHFRDCVDLCQQLGLGRVEVANRHMVGWSRMYLNEIAEACEDGRAAAKMASKVGQNRAEMLGRLLAGFMYAEQDQLARARDEVERGVTLARRLGASNFVAEGLCILSRVCAADGCINEARKHIREAVHNVREAGLTFFGPFVLGNAARLTEDPSERSSLLAEAGKILEKGCVSHNYFWFYRDAIETTLETQDWLAVERYAQALERYTDAEPLPWSDLFAARGRVLARVGQGGSDPRLAVELDRLAAGTRKAGLNAYLRSIEMAIKKIGVLE